MKSGHTNIELITVLTSAIEAVINTALRYDPASKQQLSTLTDILAIESTAPAITLYCHGTEDGVRIMGYCESPVATQLKGSPLALLSLLKQPTNLANSGVELVGSVGLLQQWQQLLQQLDIDWEDAISNVLGDIAGPLAMKTFRGSISWTHNQKEEQLRLLKEYLTEELRAIPSKTELEDFYSAVSDTAMDVDRLSARATQLFNRFKKENNDNKETSE